MALPHASNENIWKAVVVVIADGHAHAIHLDIETGGFGDIAKRSVAIVAIQLHGGSLALVARPVHRVHEQNVLPAVRVVIQEGATGAQRFRQEFAAIGAIVLAKMNTSGFGGVGQAELWRGRSERQW